MARAVTRVGAGGDRWPRLCDFVAAAAAALQRSRVNEIRNIVGMGTRAMYRGHKSSGGDPV